MISVYLLGWWITQLERGSVRSEWRQDLNLSIEKIAKMRGISLRRRVAGFLTLVTGVCGIFLFSTMSTDEPNYTTIVVVGITGGAAVIGVVISEVYSSDKAQRSRFGREKDEEYAETMRRIRGRPLTEDQVAVFARCEELEDALGEDYMTNSGWRMLKRRKQCPDLTTWSKYAPTKKVAGKAVGIVDSSAEEVASWVMHACSNERMRKSREEGNPARLMLTEKDGYPPKDNEITFATVKWTPFFLREFVVRTIWRSDKGKTSIAIESIDDNINVDDAYGRKLRKTRASTRAFWEFENLPLKEGEGEEEGENQEQCKVTLVQSVDAGGSIPAWVTNRMMPLVLSAVQGAINKFRLVRKNRALRGTMNGHQEDLESEERAMKVEEPVRECSRIFVGISFLLTSTNSVLCVCYGVTLEEKYLVVSRLIQAIAMLSFVMAVFCKPKRTDAGYMRFLCFHFFTFAVVSEVGSAIGSIRTGFTLKGWVALLRTLVRIACWCKMFMLGLKLRASAAKLPPQELSDFLCQTVLKKGTAAMGTMLFLSFETVSCFISQNSLDNGQCTGTSIAAAYLSVFLVMLTALSIVSKTMPESVQREKAWELSSIATLKGFKWWQRVQGGLITITAIASLYILSWLGVEGKEKDRIWIVGSIGLVSILVYVLIGMKMLVQTSNEQQPNTTVESPTTQRSYRTFSSGQVEEEMHAVALI
ncbi:hypothetical protein TrST_g8216 [Triparma strigata]|uniref:START domain-containing protein n=1 Tax=Triparma strigata TaxID=1606541 RepID=A0A9W7DRS1_9STRA|nr:hypothetical protein TrST_g8216 [Triparma strigata]